MRFVADHLDGAGTGMPLSWIFWDHNLFWNDENYRREIARSYPMAIGGDVSNFFFNATDGETLLEYVPNGKCCFNSLFFDLPFGTHAFELNIFCFCCCFVFFFGLTINQPPQIIPRRLFFFPLYIDICRVTM